LGRLWYEKCGHLATGLARGPGPEGPAAGVARARRGARLPESEWSTPPALRPRARPRNRAVARVPRHRARSAR
jgi:hypothetical protein